MNAMHIHWRVGDVVIVLVVWALVGLGGDSRAVAGVLVYEGFDYGSTGGAIDGRTVVNTVGLTGSYADASVGAGSMADYTTLGLSFSTNFFPTPGGALSLSLTTTATSGENRIVGVELAVGTGSGTVYESYLVRLTVNSISASDDAILVRLSDVQTATANARMGLAADTAAQASNVGISYAASSVGGSGTGALALDTTYLLVGKWTNVGMEGGGSATMWALTASGYDQWRTSGDGLEDTLGTHAFRIASQASTSTVHFNGGSFLQFWVREATGNSTNGGVLAGLFDEVRFGTSLADVTVPSKPTGILIAIR